MRRIVLSLATASLIAVFAAPAWAQSEMEQYQATGDKLLTDTRESQQQAFVTATRALRNKDYVTARRYAQAVTRAQPKSIEPWLLLGGAQIGLRDWKKARIAYASALRINSENAEARAGMGVAMAWTKDPKAQEQLAWFGQAQQRCGPLCSQAADLKRFRASIETALAEAAKPA